MIPKSYFQGTFSRMVHHWAINLIDIFLMRAGIPSVQAVCFLVVVFAIPNSLPACWRREGSGGINLGRRNRNFLTWNYGKLFSKVFLKSIVNIGCLPMNLKTIG